MEFSPNARNERRQTPRTTLSKILYVNIEPGNGGIVLNISEGGLSFHSVVPVVHHGPVRLWFSLANDNRLEISGELIWSNQTKKTGGLRFTNLTDDVKRQVRDLIGDLSVLGAGTAGAVEPLMAIGGHAQVAKQEAPGKSAAIGKIGAPVASRDPASAPTPAISVAAPGRGLPLQAAERTSRTWRSSPSPPLAGGLPAVDAAGRPRMNASWAALPAQDAAPSVGKVLAMLIGVLVLSVGGVVLYGHNHEVGLAMVRFGERLGGGARAVAQSQAQAPASPQAAGQVGAQVPEPAQAANPAPAEPLAAPAAPLVAAGKSPAGDPPADISTTQGSTTQGPQALARADETPRTSSSSGPASRRERLPEVKKPSAPPAEDSDSDADLAIAQRYLDGVGQIRNATAAAQFLWAAVAKGNSTAELTLAELYLKGDGVARSCEQARVLIHAAVSKGDVDASQALSELNRQRCR